MSTVETGEEFKLQKLNANEALKSSQKLWKLLKLHKIFLSVADAFIKFFSFHTKLQKIFAKLIVERRVLTERKTFLKLNLLS